MPRFSGAGPHLRPDQPLDHFLSRHCLGTDRPGGGAQGRVLKLIKEIGGLVITHDLRVAARICDRIMAMRAGEVVDQGATAAVYRRPQHAYTRALLNAAPGRQATFAR